MSIFFRFVVAVFAATSGAVILKSHPHKAHKKQASSHSHVMEELMIGGGVAGLVGLTLGTLGTSPTGGEEAGLN